ncbi:hypothetical protein R1flu_018669 [Riccia fluitans]|uniref:Uncharacterized protein n=1 Tax=Riccia fluitans TaxID=41844 RepID=A0ABD1ZIT5_9MARC
MRTVVATLSSSQQPRLAGLTAGFGHRIGGIRYVKEMVDLHPDPFEMGFLAVASECSNLDEECVRLVTWLYVDRLCPNVENPLLRGALTVPTEILRILPNFLLNLLELFDHSKAYSTTAEKVNAVGERRKKRNQHRASILSVEREDTKLV